MSELNVSGCARLKTLLCSFNRLKNLVISHNTKLAQLICEGNYFYQLDIRKCPALIEVVKHAYRSETREFVAYKTNTGETLLSYDRGVELIK